MFSISAFVCSAHAGVSVRFKQGFISMLPFCESVGGGKHGMSVTRRVLSRSSAINKLFPDSTVTLGADAYRFIDTH